MPLDPSISLQVRQPTDPMESMGKMMTLKELSMRIADAQQRQDEMRTLGDLYRGAIGPDSKVDNAKVLQGMAGAGLGYRIPDYQKKVADADKAAADLTKTNIEIDEKKYGLQRKRIEASNATLASLLAKPDLTFDDAKIALVNLVNRGEITPDEGERAIRMTPSDPKLLRPYLVQRALEGLEASKRLDALLPKPQAMNLGGTEQMVDMNPITNPGIVGQTFQKTATQDAILNAQTSRANNAASNAVTMRGQDLQYQQGKVPPGYRLAADGNLQAIPGGPADPSVKQQQASGKVLPILDQADSLLNAATGSYAGTAVDEALRAGGIATKGAEASAKLKALEGAIMMAQPRMEGPQSDKDVALYRQMAGQIGDSTLPVETRRAALQTIRELHQRYSAQAVPTQAPKIGAFEDGHVYMGGDPSKPSSWKKVRQ